MGKKIKWVEPELVELNSHLRDLTEGICFVGVAQTTPTCDLGNSDIVLCQDGGEAQGA